MVQIRSTYLSSVWPDWAIYLTLGKFLATINLPKYPTFLGNFCKGVKIYHFFVKSFLGNFYRLLAIFSGHTAWVVQDSKIFVSFPHERDLKYILLPKIVAVAFADTISIDGLIEAATLHNKDTYPRGNGLYGTNMDYIHKIQWMSWLKILCFLSNNYHYRDKPSFK